MRVERTFVPRSFLHRCRRCGGATSSNSSSCSSTSTRTWLLRWVIGTGTSLIVLQCWWLHNNTSSTHHHHHHHHSTTTGSPPLHLPLRKMENDESTEEGLVMERQWMTVFLFLFAFATIFLSKGLFSQLFVERRCWGGLVRYYPSHYYHHHHQHQNQNQNQLVEDVYKRTHRKWMSLSTRYNQARLSPTIRRGSFLLILLVMLRMRALWQMSLMTMTIHYDYSDYQRTLLQHQQDDKPTSSPVVFPKIVHATTRSPQKLSHLERTLLHHCQAINPDYMFHVVDDATIATFVQQFYPQYVPLLDRLWSPVMKTDVWRYLVMHKYGGIYFDTDIECVRPFDEWNAVFQHQAQVLVGVEIARVEMDLVNFAQWTMAAAPGHPVFLRTVELITNIVDEIHRSGKRPTSAIYITGPHVFSNAVLEYIDQEQLSRRLIMTHQANYFLNVSKIGILNVNAFAPLQVHSGATKNRHHPDIFVIHHFMGRWKPGFYFMNRFFDWLGIRV